MRAAPRRLTMNANLQDAELLIAMADHNSRRRAEEVEPHQRASPASAVCYMNLEEEARIPSTSDTALPNDDQQTTEAAHAGSPAPVPRAEDESDSTPRSEVPAVPDLVNESLQRLHGLGSEPSYFSPQPLRVLSSKIPRANHSTDASPTSEDLSCSAVNVPTASRSEAAGQLRPLSVGQLDRPVFQRDLSGYSTASVATVRATPSDPIHSSTPPSRQRDGPHYPNQSYAALQTQQHSAPHPPHILRAKSSHPAHHSGYSVSHISTFGLAGDHFRDIMESGSRTAGNSPASSPGLFSPTTPPLRHSQQSDDNLYASPWLHYTHRQAPKETHIADIDVDPVSGRKLVNHYEVIGELGRGVHGKVKLGRSLETGEDVAIKIVDRYSKRRRLGKNTSHEDKIKREIAILKKARHPNIVGLIEVIDDPSKKKVYIVLELVRRGEIRWRTEGAKEVCLVEWRRFQRESEGIFDNESAALEDEKIIRLAHQKLERQQRRRAKERRQQEHQENGKASWSLECGGGSEDDYSENGHSSQASTYSEDRSHGRLTYADRKASAGNEGTNMETAFRSSTPTATARTEDPSASTGLEGTMYGAYDTEAFRDRTPSLAGSCSSHFTEGDEEVPEHFHYVPLMSIQAAREAFRDTVLGLEYLHYQGVIHRDIKPANLLQTENRRIKISDFGVSYLGRRPINESNGDQSESDVQDADDALELAKTVGTPAFYAPELCHTELDFDNPRIDSKIDIWALGVTLYCLIYGRVPFHDHNQWLLMKHIRDDEPYIPKYRLKPVAEGANSRPSSHGQMYYSLTSGTRAPHDLEYEEVDEDLRDLLQRMFVKDPRNRISIPEIKRHPWLTRDIENFNSWVEETDPDRSSHGRRIEISKDDIQNAVVPFNTIMDRVRFGIHKVREVAKSLTRQRSRRRAQSSTSGQDGPHRGSTNSSSSTISQEGRRPSLGPTTYIYEALSKSRESDHPLSQSVTASPEAGDRSRYFESPSSRTGSPAHITEGREYAALGGQLVRPHLADRAQSAVSSANSIRTVRQPDASNRLSLASPGIPPALPGTPTALDTPGGTNLGGIFGGMPKRVVREARSDEKMLKLPREHGRTKSIDRLVVAGDDAHTGPSLAISTAVASGRVDQPDLLKELSPTIARSASPSFSDYRSPSGLERTSSRQSSVSSISSRLQRSWTAHSHEFDAGPTLEMPLPAHIPLFRDTSDEMISRVKEEFVRRRVREEHLNRERPRSGTFQRPPSALSQSACPPSPDDEIDHSWNRCRVSHETSPVTVPIITPVQQRTLTSSSSEDQFTSMSQSTSNPSIPSVASADSSLAPDECSRIDSYPRMTTTGSENSIHVNQFDAPTDDPAGYDGDHVIESDDDSEEEEFLMMGRKKPIARSGSVSNAELARSSIRKEMSGRRRSARSGSNGTVKKIPPPGESGNEQPPETQ